MNSFKIAVKIVVVLALSVSAALAQVYLPGGRLTLVSNTPVMTSDVSNATTVYYVPYVGNNVTTATGSPLANSYFSSQLTLTLNSALVSGDIYDIFVISNSNTLVLCTGPAWSSSTSRGSGTGTTQLTTAAGLSVNAVAITSCMNGSTSYSVSASAGFYLGSVYMTGTGETSMQLQPAAVSGGTNNVLGLYNAYNRVPLKAYCGDNSYWGYSTASWRQADASTSNRITWLDGLQQSFVAARYQTDIIGSSTVTGRIGIDLDSTTATPGGSVSGPNTVGNAVPSVAQLMLYPQLGLHFVQAVEYATGSTVYFVGADLATSGQDMLLTLEVNM